MSNDDFVSMKKNKHYNQNLDIAQPEMTPLKVKYLNAIHLVVFGFQPVSSD